jgi:small toxic polypeptide LdrA/B/C/D
MTRYLLLSLAVLAVPLTFAILKHPSIFTKRFWLTLLSLLVLTAIFDNLIIWAGIVEYNSSHILDWYIGLAPIEDFFYTIGAALLIPLLWREDERKN